MAINGVPERVQARVRSLERERDDWISEWRDLARFLLPRRGKFLAHGDQSGKDLDRHSYIIDGTPIRALRIFASGMQAGLTSSQRKWFRLGLENPDLEKYGPIAMWLQKVEEVLYRIFATTNFYPAARQVYEEEGGFGTACEFIQGHPTRVARYKVMTVGTYCLGTDEFGVVDTLFRHFSMTAKNMVKVFGTRVPKSIANIANDASERWFEIGHLIERNYNRSNRFSDNLNMEYRSWYFTYRDFDLLRVGGYEEKPFVAPRWAILGDQIYSEGPGHDSLGDSKMLQEENKDKLRGLHKLVDPPMKAGPGLKGRVKHVPRGVTHTSNTGNEFLQPLYQIQPDIGAIREDIQDVREQIRQGFFNDLFLFIQSNPYATATEIMEKHEEKLMMLGPAIEQQFTEFHEPCISRSFALAVRAGKIPPPPPDLISAIQAGEIAEIKVEFISLLAQAQKAIGTRSIREVLGFTGELASLYPESIDNINPDRTWALYHSTVGAPVEMKNSDEEKRQIREIRARQQELAAKIQQGQAALEAAETASKVDLSGKNVLTEGGYAGQ